MRLPSRGLLSTLSADYAYGLETHESHRETVDTFNPWLADYMKMRALEPAVPPLPTEAIFFTNFFVSRVDWWFGAEVRRLLDAINASGGVYRNRWGDAPIQTAALRLHGSQASIHHLDVKPLPLEHP